MKRNPLSSWRIDFDLLADRSFLAIAVGLVLVAILVPVLNIWHGTRGQFAPSIAVFFLAPILLAAALGGRGPGTLVAVGSLLVWDWYFITPYHTVTVITARGLLTLVVFMGVGALTGQFATTARNRTREALDRARSSEALYDLSAALIGRRDFTEVLPAVIERLRHVFDLKACALLLPSAGSVGGEWRTVTVAGSLPDDLRVEFNRHLTAIAAEAVNDRDLSREQSRSEVNPDLPATGMNGVQFHPLRVGTSSIGILELVHKPGVRPDLYQERLLATFANGVAIALEQERLSEEEQAAAVARESDRLKSVLLSSVSHDLRTPLAGIKAAIGSLLRRDVHWSDEDRMLFLADIDAETDRLTRLVSNLLDVSRIEAGAIKPKKEWEDVGDLIRRVVGRLESRRVGCRFLLDMPDALPLVRIDAVEIEQVLTNLLENAAKYSPPGSSVTVSAGLEEASAGEPTLRIAVTDRGLGIAPAEQEKIFDKFYRGVSPMHPTSGTGMGLTIVKGLVEAHGGRVLVDSSPERGSTFTVLLPVELGDAAVSMSLRKSLP